MLCQKCRLGITSHPCMYIHINVCRKFSLEFVNRGGDFFLKLPDEQQRCMDTIMGDTMIL